MKWKKKAILQVSLIIVLLLCTSPISYDSYQASQNRWFQEFPNWYCMSPGEQEDLIRLYKLSPKKWQWFPDSFPDRPVMRFTIRPRSHYK